MSVVEFEKSLVKYLADNQFVRAVTIQHSYSVLSGQMPHQGCPRHAVGAGEVGTRHGLPHAFTLMGDNGLVYAFQAATMIP